MHSDFLAASAEAAKALTAAQARHERLNAAADTRLDAAKARHRRDFEAAMTVEAAAWSELLAIPGMSVPTAARITGASASAVTRWAARARQASPPCS
jgi:predicted DNA-binding helix-hairpin-helix protein